MKKGYIGKKTRLDKSTAVKKDTQKKKRTSPPEKVVWSEKGGTLGRKSKGMGQDNKKRSGNQPTMEATVSNKDLRCEREGHT